ncbi:MAG: alkaline phosphatase family protein, partial [Anaerolineales bacterium]|nr:alkaline phosphatase family protein [Anaerolineales bacterium]
MAHKAGPDRSAAFEALRIIDRAIRQVNRMRVRYRRREYDLYIMSDHGNTPSVPFSWVHEGTLGDAIRAQIGEPINLVELVGAHLDSSEHARFMLDEVRGIERRLSPRLRRISASARLYVRRRLLTPGGSDYNLSRQGDIVVSANGPLAHIYFNVADRPLDLAEVLLLYPQLVDALLSTPGIGVVAGRAERRTVILAPGSGVLTIGPTGRHLDGQHPLDSFGDVAYAEAQLHRLVQFPHAGDLVVLGGMLPDGRVVTFEKQLATHGSLGGTQLQAFVARPPECPLAINTLDDPEALYTYFTARYLSDLDTGPGERLTRLCEMGTAQRFG